jgi:two-component system sensor histidine kinase BaeS
MILSIRTKLFIAVFLACLLTVGGVASFVQFNFKRSFLDYLHEQENRSLDQIESDLIQIYAIDNSWQPLQDEPRQWDTLLRNAMRSNLRPPNGDVNTESAPPYRREIGGVRPPHRSNWQRIDRFTSRVVLLDSNRKLLKGNTYLGIPDDLQELKSAGKTIGYLGVHRRQDLTEKVDMEFAERWQHILWLAGLLALPIAGLLSYLFARHLGRPIQALRNGTKQLTDGNYALRMRQQGQDELGQLTQDVNKLAERLQQNETSRKQWIADIAHELRTPIAILRGEIEALQDGINQPDAQTFNSLHQEVSHLQRLVNDLYELSMSDSGALSYQKTAIDIIALLRETLTLHSTQLHEHSLHIDTLGIGLQPATVQGDPQRLQQLFKNLLENSLRYTDKPGQLRVSTALQNHDIIITFEDSAPGVPDESIPRLFERLYRVEGSRNRATGGAGIGLSLCLNIAQAHEGSISAHHSPLGGLQIQVRLPLIT